MYRLSRFVPVRFRSTYTEHDGDQRRRVRSTWWQWRDRIAFHRIERLGPA